MKRKYQTPNARKQSARTLAFQVLCDVVQNGLSTSQTLRSAQQQCQPKELAQLKQLVMGTLQHWFGLQAELADYLSKPLKAKDQDIQCLLSLGLYQLRHSNTPNHAAISETVNLCPPKKRWAKGLCNAVLRRASQTAAPPHTADLPEWLSQTIQQDWPQQATEIAHASNQAAPLSLRCTGKRSDYLARLAEAQIGAEPISETQHGIRLSQGGDITQLPGFAEGAFIAQDGAAQLSTEILNPQPTQRLLDACCAPGGKTTHLRQLAPKAELLAIDNDEQRLARVRENLERLGQHATVICADASKTDWWDGQAFDSILLDAPCSATGVIRRHPDIKLLRRKSDISTLAALQQSILQALWATLKPGGKLLYCTCSILKQENEQQMAAFLSAQSDAKEIEIQAQWGHSLPHGRQILPGMHGMDGFYYCLLEKQSQT